MNTSVQTRQFSVSALSLGAAEATTNRTAASDRTPLADSPSSLMFVLWLGLGALLSLGWAVTLVLLASYVLGLL